MAGIRCANCPFKTGLCGTKGPEDSPFVIVGESPGSRELLTGRPFSGPSGKMLEEILERTGFNSLGIKPYYINALSCYPAGKDMAKLEAGTRACNGRVQEQLKAHPRKVILALGAAASWAVTGDYSIRILRDRGRLIQKPELCEDGVVLAVHPAYLLRNGGGLSVWQKDLRQAVELLKGNKPDEWVDPTWAVVSKPSEYIRLVEDYVATGGLVTADKETGALHFMDEKVLCLGITRGDGNHVDIIPENLFYSMPHVTKKLLEAPPITWSWHNGIFDIKWAWVMGIKARVDEDTMLMSYALNEKAGYHDLDQVAQHWIKAPRHKHMLDNYVKKGESYRVIPKDILYKYNAIDLSKQHKIFAPLREEIRANPLLEKLYTELLIPAVPFIASMQTYGVAVDVDVIKQNELEHDKELAELRAKLNVYAREHMGTDINPNSPMQMKELLYGRLGLGRMVDSTNEAALIEIERRGGHPVVDLLLKHREVAKRKGTYVSNILPNPERKKNPAGFIKKDGRIHPDFKLHGTETGRLAGADPNMLNQPRGPLIRGQYVAKPGCIFVEVDLNQAELRSLATMSRDPLLIDIYTKNETSIHDVTTSEFYASKADIMSNEEVAARVRSMLHLSSDIPGDRVYGEAKMRGKAVNFGIVYGRTDHSLAKEFDTSVEEAARWINKWMATYSGAAEFIQWCRRAPANKRDLITVYGRHKRWGVVTNENLRNLQNEAANFPHQSTASDIMLETAILTYERLRDEWGAMVWNEVYDALYFEVEADDTKVAESIQFVQKVITEVPLKHGLDVVPFLGDAKIGYTWGSMVDFLPGEHTIEGRLGTRK